MSLRTKEWFREWFDSPYYHILYNNRDYAEAQLFIDKLAQLLQFHPDDTMLDVACGKGRHSIYLNKKGYDVTGIDISPQSIAYAKQFENRRLHFYVHDMRQPFGDETFDYVLNLFTSFGYFETEAEDVQSLWVAWQALKPDGKLVLDFFNTPVVLQQLPPYEQKFVGNIDFRLRKRTESGYILKDIDFEANGKAWHFQERVKAIRREDFLRYFEQAGLQPLHLFGDYHLNPYDEQTSPRLIFVAERKK